MKNWLGRICGQFFIISSGCNYAVSFIVFSKYNVQPIHCRWALPDCRTTRLNHREFYRMSSSRKRELPVLWCFHPQCYKCHFLQRRHPSFPNIHSAVRRLYHCWFSVLSWYHCNRRRVMCPHKSHKFLFLVLTVVVAIVALSFSCCVVLFCDPVQPDIDVIMAVATNKRLNLLNLIIPNV